MDSTDTKDIAKTLRDMADAVESREEEMVFGCKLHYEDVTRPEYGDAVIDRKLFGRTITLHIGDLVWMKSHGLLR